MLVGIDAHCLEAHRTGAGRYLFNLLKEWQNLKRPFRFILYFKNEIPKDISESEVFEKKTLDSSSDFLFVHWHLPMAAKQDKVELLFCPAYQQPIFYSGKVALTIHDIIYQAHPEWHNWSSVLEKIIFQWIFRRSAKKANLIFVPSKFTKQEIIKYYQVAADKIKVLPYAVDESFRVLEKNDEFHSHLREIKKKYGLADKYIFCLGSIFERRFIPEVISAFSQAVTELKQRQDGYLQFFIVGRDCTQRKIDELIKKANHKIGEGAIKKIDYIDEKDLIYLQNGAELFIWLSSYEGFGLPPLEAMACGVPVITTDMTSLAEVVGDSPVIIKDPSNVSEIKKALISVLTNEELRTQLAQAGLNQAQKFSWKRCAQESLKFLEELI